MPLYEYQCTSCGERTEVLLRLGAAPPTRCPHCGGTLEKLISAPALKFKGTGWYVTDYANRKGKDAAGAAASGETTKAEKPSESKPTGKPAASDTKAKAS